MQGELEIEREIAERTLNGMSANAILFELFPAGSRSPVEAYIEGVTECDIFVLLLWKSFAPPVRKEYEEAVRLGRPILVLLKSLKDGEAREPDLTTFVDMLRGYDVLKKKRVVDCFAPTLYKEYRTLASFEKALSGAVAEEIGRLFAEPFYTESREDMYRQGIRVVSRSRRRILMFQNSSSLLLGPKPYDSVDGKDASDEDFVVAVDAWLEASKGHPSIEFRHVYLLSGIQDALALLKTNAAFMAAFRNRVKKYVALEAETRGRISFRAVAKPFSGPVMVGDDFCGIWITGAETAVAVVQENAKLADTVAHILRTNSADHIPLADLESRL